MRLKTCVARLDAYSGGLSLHLAMLERAAGSGDVGVQFRILPFLAEARAVADRVDLRPWRLRGAWATGGGIALFALWDLAIFVLPDLWDTLGPRLELLPLLGLVALGAGACSFGFHAWRHRQVASRFGILEQAARKGVPLQELLDMDV